MGDDPLKGIAEQRMRRSLDRHTVLYDLQLAYTIQAKKIQRVCIEYILDHFDQLAEAKGLDQLDKELLIEIIQAKAKDEDRIRN